MKKALLHLVMLFIGTTTIVFGQTQKSDQRFRNEQDSVYSNLFTNTERAKKKLDSLFELEDQMSDTTRALNYNLLGIYLNLTGQQDSSIAVFQKGLEINGDHAYRKPKLLTNLGTALRNSGKYNQSLEIFRELEEYYLEIGDSLGHAETLGESAAIYNLTLQNEKAVQNLTRAISIFERHNGKASNHGVMLQRLANTYMKQEKYDFALDIYDKALAKFKSADRMDNYYLTLINVADCYQYKGEYEKGLTTIEKSIEGLKHFGNSRLLAVAYGVRGDQLKNLNKTNDAQESYEEALFHAYKISSNRTLQIAREFLELLIQTENFERAERLIKETKPYLEDANIEYQYSYLEVAADYRAAINQFEKAVELHKRVHILKDSSYYENKQQLVDDIQALYRVQEREQENRSLNKTIVQKEESISLLTIGTIILVILCLFVIVIWVTRSNYQKRIISLEKSQRAELESKLRIERENAQLKERLIEQQKTELLGYSMEVANMNEKIDNLIQNAEKEGQDSNIGQQLKSLITVNKSWDSFIARFKEVEPDFIPRLSKTYPNLTQKDLEFCSLVRINVSYKDIANFLQISHESVFKKRYRIAQKMELEKGTDFQKFIIQF